MQRTTKTSAAVFVIALTALLSLASLGLRHQLFGPGGATLAAPPQGPFNNPDNFILNNNSLKGTFAGVLSGTLLAPPPAPPALTAVSYVQKADGNGHITDGKATVNINGQVFTDVLYAGEYTVKADGTISSQIVPSTGPLTGVTILANGVVTETEKGQITEHRDVLHTGIVATSVVKKIMR